jgi:hypothetical protein
MEWYEIIGFIVIWIAGLWLSGSFMNGGKDISIMIVGEGGEVNREDA